MWAFVMFPGRLFATSVYSTVPVASSVTWKTARPRDAFVAAAQCGTSSSAFRTATKVVGGGASATAAVPIAANVRAAVARATESLRMSDLPAVEWPNKSYGQQLDVDQIAASRLPGPDPSMLGTCPARSA